MEVFDNVLVLWRLHYSLGLPPLFSYQIKDSIYVNNGRKCALDVSFILCFEVYEFINCLGYSKIKSVGSALDKMTIKATENCIGCLMAKGINAVDIAVQNPTVTLHTDYWQSLKIDCTRQVDTSSSNSVNWFESLMTCMDMTETELDAILTESEDDNFLFDSIDCVVQAIKSIYFPMSIYCI